MNDRETRELYYSVFKYTFFTVLLTGSAITFILYALGAWNE